MRHVPKWLRRVVGYTRVTRGLYWRLRWKPFVACRAKARHQVSMYDDPANEALVTCPACLEWLNEPTGMHRLLVTRHGTEEYLRRMIREQPGKLHYTDVPSGKTGIVESEDDLPG